MIFFDTETTGLPVPECNDINLQPEIIEFAAIKTDNNLNIIGQIDFLCKPRNPVTQDTIKIHGITNQMLKDKDSFASHLKALNNFFKGNDTLIAHNINYDVKLLSYELVRSGHQHRFPWSFYHIDTEQVFKESGLFESLKLSEVYITLFGEKMPKAHRAVDDVINLIKCYKELQKRRPF